VVKKQRVGGEKAKNGVISLIEQNMQDKMGGRELATNERA
jgi:hypothetical protein